MPCRLPRSPLPLGVRIEASVPLRRDDADADADADAARAFNILPSSPDGIDAAGELAAMSAKRTRP